METTEVVVGARVTRSEKEKIDRAAKMEARSTSEWLRKLARSRADKVLNGDGGEGRE